MSLHVNHLKGKRANRLVVLFLLAASVFSASGCDDDNNNPVIPTGTTALTIAVFSDPHLYDTTLGTSGTAFETYLAEDRKLLRESEPILRSVVDGIKASEADVVLVSGDLTKDGEQVCHNKMALYLAELEAAGKRVFVVPGNHDINNQHGARSYSNAGSSPVPTISPAQFKSIYNQYGYDEALATDPNSLSYTVKLTDNLWLIAMDACRYNENTANTTFTGGRFSAETLDWIKNQLHQANAQGVTVLGMMHHGVMEHYTGQTDLFEEYVVADWRNIYKTFADSGMKAIFTGHFHASDIVRGNGTTSGKFLFDIETSSSVTYPCAYRIVAVGKDNNTFSSISVQTKRITAVSGNFGGKTFQQYAKSYLETGAKAILTNQLITQYGLSAQDAALPAQLLTDAAIAHYQGDESPNAQTRAAITALLLNQSETYQMFGRTLQNLWTDPAPADNNVVINLKTGVTY